jgi:hypothetical protein
MSEPFVPPDFEAPSTFAGPGFHLEPLGPVHNERDHEAWMSSIDHIRSTPGMDWRKWPTPMTLEENLTDMETHAREFEDRVGFTYSILDGDDVIGCVYIYPDDRPDVDARVRSWVRVSRAEMDAEVWRSLSRWLAEEWPFERIDYAPREIS